MEFKIKSCFVEMPRSFPTTDTNHYHSSTGGFVHTNRTTPHFTTLPYTEEPVHPINPFDFMEIAHFILREQKKQDRFPKINYYRVEDEFHMEVALAGYNKDNLKAHISEKGEFVISYENQVSDNKDYICKEISKKDFKRVFPLPDFLDLINFQHEFKDGILHIKFKIKEERKPRQIKIL